MSRPANQVIIDLSALRYNFARIRDRVGPRTAVMAVVKADAYGHGLVETARTLEDAGAQRLAVAHLFEGVRLREAGARCPIVILCGILTREEAGAVVTHDLIPVLADPAPVDMLAEESRRRGRRTPVQLKIDTGMGRLGMPYTETGSFVDTILRRNDLKLDGLMSHLSSADEPDRRFTEAQILRFLGALETARARGGSLQASSLANSAGILEYPKAHVGMVRPGILLYGGFPSPEARTSFGLHPVMTLRARVLQVRDLPEGTPVSYGRTYVTPAPARIAVISAGYSDGLPRALSNRGTVLIRGRRYPIRGRVCMNLIMADVTEWGEVLPGDEAVFLGRQGEAVLTGDDVAGACGTISYEIYCAVGRCGERITIS